ncbi:uncharacterized protein LOC125718760 [Brienomyrus brachyistius]|uniref:uncharacterized protein LOC125718760 n=1 Tax=Brienomyrus brachyistius TaxID=42636 RepID=UPI0020B217AC|nr:uncharacterized protein LOC125718760 [Brienomyrus brachyistius]
MEEELQELRNLVLQLRTDNEQLRQQQVACIFEPGATPSTSAPHAALSSPIVPAGERVVFVPRERKCPMFGGRSGIGLDEWLEEVQACMRARHLAVSDQAFFLFDHLEGEAREEIRYRSGVERGDPACIIDVLQELYGCSEPYVALQEAFFSRRQQEGETLQEFSLSLMGLMEKVKQRAPSGTLNADVLLRDQFVEHVLDGALRRELKQMVRRQPTATLLDVRGEAIRWEREGLPSSRGRSQSVPSACGIQYGVQGNPRGVGDSVRGSEMRELRELLKGQQEQLRLLTRSVELLQSSHQRSRFPRSSSIICRRCQRPGHIARECDGVQAPSRFQSSAAPPFSGGEPHPQPASGN